MAKEAKFKSSSQAMTVSGLGNRDGKARVSSPRGGSWTERRIFEQMLFDPTIKLAMDVIIAMLKRQPWSVEPLNPETADADYVNWVWEQIEPYREMLILSALRGVLLDGWRAFEVVYGPDEESGQTTVLGIKPLRSANTTVLVFEDTGDPAGVEVRNADGQIVQIDEKHTILVNFDDDGFGDLGDPLLRTAKGAHLKWEDCDEGARRYDKKVAGGFLFIQYPIGTSPYSENGGAETDNAIIGKAVAESFQSAGYALAPRRVDPDTGKPEDSPWSVEHIAAGGGLQPNFVTRAKYLDALKLRAFGIPERSTTEGTFGTKAEAEAHADIGVIVNLDRHARILQAINNGLIEAINEENTGDPWACRLILGKLDPADRELFSAIFTSLMTDPVFGEQVAQMVDVEMLLDKLNIPTRSEEEIAELEAEAEAEAEDAPPAPGEDTEETEETPPEEEVA